ncbi:WAPL (Wings apart-like protein regulation of heterochromatin) protein [Forsythia ovata]|uniref:WAPL (Wings apart-like protein regulation of heterochromatin) protein n=1 Tax=Forsythia ovata TaxID=205694 RepID=A0ABD1QAM5_9LAMI
MIVRKYGRRNRSLTRSCSESNGFDDVDTDGLSQECPQDIYDFTYSSQVSTQCHWPDSYGLNSSQESRQLTILGARKGAECEDPDRALWKPKKVKVFDIDSEPNGSNSSQDMRELAIFPGTGGQEDGVFEFSDGDIWNSKKAKNVDLDPYGLDSSQESGELAVLSPRKSSENWFSWDCGGISGNYKRVASKENGVLQKNKNKNNKKAVKSKELGSGVVGLPATLMETQEFGEMMEHVDEVNFALDGLKKGQPVRIRRASLLSFLSICGTAQQRRLLRAHGMAKTIIHVVSELSFDDPPSNLAAAALFYILTSDGQDDHLLDSHSCIRFLIRMLKPPTSDASKEKTLTIGSKLMGICKDAGILQDSSKGPDSSSDAIMLKVQEILINCKEIKPRDKIYNGGDRPELTPKWISLLTMEKACLSTVSIEDTSGTVRKSGVNFKEKLREFGGLDAVFEVARKCHSVMEGWLERSPSLVLDSKDVVGLESLVLLLKCLKIMENATFLSKDNQCHLLGMKGNFDSQRAPRTFTKLILSVIKILSGVSLLKNSWGSSQDEKLCGICNGSANSSERPLITYAGKVEKSFSPCTGCGSMEWTSSEKSFSAYQDDRCISSDQPGCSKSSLEITNIASDPWLLKMRIESSTSGSCSGTSGNSINGVSLRNNGSELKFGIGKINKVSEGANFGFMEDSQDPFAFHDDEFEPSKWDLLSGKRKKSRTENSGATVSEHEDRCHSLLKSSQQETRNLENHCSQEASCSSTADENKSDLLAYCLLTAVKVLMNLTNDNPEGCRQIAACGGLETLSSLIAGHFPSFSLSSPLYLRENSFSSKSNVETNQENSPHLTDQELDFLVAILGLLVNLVEKDCRNRSWLATGSVSLPSLEGMEEDRKGVIPLLCSIFLANQGAGEATGEGKCLSWDDEDSILQGEREAEKMIVEAYAALLLAFLSTESKSIHNAIAECLPDHNLAILVPVLERFVEFHLTLNMISPETHKNVLEVIESCRIR